ARFQSPSARSPKKSANFIRNSIHFRTLEASSGDIDSPAAATTAFSENDCACVGCDLAPFDSSSLIDMDLRELPHASLKGAGLGLCVGFPLKEVTITVPSTILLLSREIRPVQTEVIGRLPFSLPYRVTDPCVKLLTANSRLS